MTGITEQVAHTSSQELASNLRQLVADASKLSSEDLVALRAKLNEDGVTAQVVAKLNAIEILIKADREQVHVDSLTLRVHWARLKDHSHDQLMSSLKGWRKSWTTSCAACTNPKGRSEVKRAHALMNVSFNTAQRMCESYKLVVVMHTAHSTAGANLGLNRTEFTRLMCVLFDHKRVGDALELLIPADVADLLHELHPNITVTTKRHL